MSPDFLHVGLSAGPSNIALSLVSTHPRIVKVSLCVQFRNEHFFFEQGRTRVCGKAYSTSVAARKLRRRPLGEKGPFMDEHQLKRI
jgi:hypothetical protein